LLSGRDHRSNVVVQPEPSTRTHLLELLDRRAALLSASASSNPAELAGVTDELTAVLSAGAPLVRRVDADEPGDLLTRMVEQEPVHPFSQEDPVADLADRLQLDRRCFVLEHPLLPGHPMNVVWVALRRGVACRIEDILDPRRATLDPKTATSAVFYSIWNVEPGLVGVPGGSALLSGAIEAIGHEFPGVEEYVTLSPIPGFRDWWLAAATTADDAGHHDAGLEPSDVQNDTMERACARYLCTLGADGRPIDAVARFHLGNGARLIGLNRAADLSAKGMRRSFGLMANYRYSPEDRAQNRAALSAGRPAVAEAIGDLLASTEPR